MNQVERLSALAGNNTKLAKLCGVHPSRVTHWKQGLGFVPAKYHQKLLDAAKREKLPITLADFFDAEPKPKRRKLPAASVAA